MTALTPSILIPFVFCSQEPGLNETFTSENIEKEDAKVTKLCSELAQIKDKYENAASPWLFGTEYGTALDAHLLILLARLEDVGGEKVVHPRILAHGHAIMDGALWKSFMQGRATMASPSGD